ncbi:MBL fold metallo-hydrolase [Dysgonomonas sp. 511]|uniref:MBL fold metallo-hydrolase n=1 Tax=Dysgonomonas sp. 511 TaxID=2302930 RepID=UPI0013D37CBE|nr:MBL fold metallo-hydrolase [Dysgonomonas sp. 511]NDV77617.1 MBL fold metallo-hydrolase [Dysgonomonas sp. 511]
MFDIKIINTGFIMADGGAMFGAIPKRAWQRKYGADEDNLCRLALRCLLLISDSRKILVDTGIDPNRLHEIPYYQPHNNINLSDELAAYGLKNEDITDVILSHLHFDHCGYVCHKEADGRISPSFPNARYWLSRKQWDNCLNPNRLEAASVFKEDIQFLSDNNKLALIDEDVLLDKNIHLRLFDGHSQGQIVVYANMNGEVYTFPGDLIPTAAHVALEWISAYDICALSSLNEKLRFLSEAADNGYTLIYCHDVRKEKGKVKRLNGNFISV